jgi:hypothetical protein
MITFKQFINKGKAYFKKYNTSGKHNDEKVNLEKHSDQYYTSTHTSGEHNATVSFITATNKKVKDHWHTHFTVDDAFHGSNEHISPHHKHQLMRHIGHSINHFITKHKPKRLSFSSSSTNIDSDANKKRRQYRNVAELFARKHNGKATHSKTESHIDFEDH